MSRQFQDCGAGYRYTAHNMLEFSTLDAMPINVNMEAIDEGDGIESAFIKHEAVWHNNCCTKFSSDKLERARKAHKRKFESDSVTCDPSPVKTRRSSMANKNNKSVCFFCDQGPEIDTLHLASKLDTDRQVRTCAIELKDTNSYENYELEI